MNNKRLTDLDMLNPLLSREMVEDNLYWYLYYLTASPAKGGKGYILTAGGVQ